METLSALAQKLKTGEVTSLSLVTECLDIIESTDDPAAPVYLARDRERALAEARRIDALRKEGRAHTPFAGIPISVKALFDLEGMVTTAGSAVLADAPPATEDAEIVRRLRAAGFVILGHTNMTEFAYSGLGINPHFGTPANPADPATPRIPGGSSSGAAVSVARRMAAAAIGTDTGGSCRIPAAFCGLTGYKPTASRIPLKGAYPLSRSLDSIGPIGVSVECCALLDAIMAGETPMIPSGTDPSNLRLAVLENYVTEDVTKEVAAAFSSAIERLSRAGARIEELGLKDLDRLPELNARGGIVAHEALSVHKELLASSAHMYDPRVSVRIQKAMQQEPGEYDRLIAIRRDMIRTADKATDSYDAVLYPTTPFTAPTLAELEDEEAYGKANLLVLRNPTVANFLDRCAISIPLPADGGLPVGMNLMGANGGDRSLLGVAMTVQALLGR